MRPDMKLMPARVSYRVPARFFISGAGLSYCCVYMMLERYETFISGRHENFMSPFHENGMKISCKQNFLTSGRYENQIAFVDCCMFFVFFMTYLESFISGDMVK